jgi:hypothetical protein
MGGLAFPFLLLVGVVLDLGPDSLGEEMKVPSWAPWEGKPVGTMGIPSWGDWAGKPIGTWIIKAYRETDPGKPERTKVEYRRQLLLGEDSDGQGYIMSGRVDEQGKYLEKPSQIGYLRGTGAGGQKGPTSKATKTLQVDGQRIECEVWDYGHYTEVDGSESEKTVTVLKEQPALVLEERVIRTDSFRGESFKSEDLRLLKSVGTVKMYGQDVRIFKSESTWSSDGRVGLRKELTQSPDVPGIVVYEKRIYYNKESEVRHVTEWEVKSVGCSPDEAKEHTAAIKRWDFGKRQSPDSEVFRANIALLTERGFSELQAAQVFAERLSDQEFYKGLARQSKQIELARLAYENTPSEQNRELLIKSMDRLNWSADGLTEPQVERELLAVAKSGDPPVRVRACAALAHLVPARYTRLAEETIIREKVLDVQALKWLADGPFGSPRRVIESFDFPIDRLPPELITYAPDEQAVALLLRRFREAKKWGEKGKVLDILKFFDSPEVRQFFRDQAESLGPQDLRGQSEKSRHISSLYDVVAIQGIRGAKELFRKWTMWCAESSTPVDENQAVLKSIHGLLLIEAVLKSGDVNLVTEMIRTLEERNPEMLARLLLSLRNKPRLAPKISIDAATAAKLEHVQVDTGFGPLPANELLRLLRPVLHGSPTKANLELLLKECFPNYDPGLDFKELAAATCKGWYQDRKGLKPFDPGVSTENVRKLCDELPNFGAEGAEMLVHLYDWPPFRREVLVGLRRIEDKNDPVVQEFIRSATTGPVSTILIAKQDQKRIDCNYEIVLWCYGDIRRREEIEFFLRQTGTAWCSEVYDALPYAPRSELLYLVGRRDAIGIDRRGRLVLAQALAKHPDKECANAVLDLWDEEGDRRMNPEFAECFNRMADKNFGMQKSDIQRWVGALK